MIDFRLHDLPMNDAAPAAAAPLSLPGFLKVTERLQQWIDRRLGYFGNGRFVFFYYEPRGEEVMWNDGRSYGFGSGGWQTFQDVVEPLGRRLGINLTPRAENRHVLVIDRHSRQAYFADREKAEALVCDQHKHDEHRPALSRAGRA